MGDTAYPVKGESHMDAIIGSYRAHMKEAGLILTHPVGISFDLTVDETLGLLNFISVYRQVLLEMQDDQGEGETEPHLERTVIQNDED
jgi:hypothetical protein